MSFLKLSIIFLLAALFFRNLLSAGIPENEPFSPPPGLPEHLVFGIPSESDLILSRRGFSLGYSKKRKQALWVSYILTAEQCSEKKVRRKNTFKVDPALRYDPVHPKDYKGSGFDKGHLAPAGDMAYSVESMKNSFYMTNISPQLPGCNRGIWKRLETQVRRWAEKERRLSIVTGPLFKKRNKRIKEGKVPVPYAFYKVLLDMTSPMKMIGFVIPNQTSKKNLSAFAVTVDHVEEVTGLDFFSGLEDSLEDKLESSFSFDLWQQPPAPVSIQHTYLSDLP
ncbi:MAG: DNA/RNA non-specific endonuclease [Lentisphaeria bacterium]|nr:DNA/RNA non-specific endonuclease [Lentisphaeria bacterium]